MEDINTQKYVLISGVYNEEAYIENTIKSVVNQTVKPAEWIIVSDGSTDGTDDIIKRYAERYHFIKYIRFINTAVLTSNLGKVAKRVVAAINEGYKSLTTNDYAFLGILDGDVTFATDYYEKQMGKFNTDHSLGLSGGYIYNVMGNKKWDYFVKPNIVGGPIQFFKRKCWVEIDGYFPGGHQDYYAVVKSKMKGWKVQSFPDLEVLHHKHASLAGKSQVKAKFHLGQMDRICGEYFIYSLVRAISLLKKKPFIIGGVVRIVGYIVSWLKKDELQVPPELHEYLHQQQIRKIVPQKIYTLFKKGKE